MSCGAQASVQLGCGFYFASLFPEKVALSDRLLLFTFKQMHFLPVVSESFAYNDIALAFDRRTVMTSTVYHYQLGCKARTVANVLDLGLISTLYSPSDGAPFSGNSLAQVNPAESACKSKLEPHTSR